jgi:hypothetical protein
MWFGQAGRDGHAVHAHRHAVAGEPAELEDAGLRAVADDGRAGQIADHGGGVRMAAEMLGTDDVFGG